MATAPKKRGDFRHTSTKKYRIGRLEIRRLSQKPANGGLFGDIVGEISGDWTGWLTTLDSNRRVPV